MRYDEIFWPERDGRMDIKINQEIIDRVISLRRYFHRNPELGMEEYNTSKKVAQILEELGLRVKSNIANTGVMGYLEGGRDGRTVLLRADMDALPIHEENDLPYSSQVPGKMHACGHDAHTAILLGVAMVLAEQKDKIRGNVKFIFQPAEETVGGAEKMIKEGVIEEFSRADFTLGLHMDSSIPTGEITLALGASNASSDMLSIIIEGKGTHGASPHTGIDVILMAGQLLSNLQGIISRNISPVEPAVLTIGVIKGGSAANVIPERVELEGILRTMDKEVRDICIDKIKDHLDGLVIAHGGSYKLDVRAGYPPLVNNKDIAEYIVKHGMEILGDNKVHIFEKPRMGVEDFAYFLQEIPGVFWYLGCRNEEKGIIYPGHNPKFNIDEEAMVSGIKIQTAAVLDLLK